MTKKLFLTLAIISFFASCGTRRSVVQDPAIFDEGVVINGIRWATRNVAAPFRFAANPEDAGMFFQWNRRIGMNADNSNVRPFGTTWSPANDPCPQGWRVPSMAELNTLLAAGSEWTNRNGVYGRYFGTGQNRIFLPATGWRGSGGNFLGSLHGGGRGALTNVGAYGAYWSRTQLVSPQVTSSLAWALWFFSDGSNVNSINQAFGFSVRCVAE